MIFVPPFMLYPDCKLSIFWNLFVSKKGIIQENKHPINLLVYCLLYCSY